MPNSRGKGKNQGGDDQTIDPSVIQRRNIRVCLCVGSD